MCSFSSLWEENAAGHFLQVNGSSAECSTDMCAIRSPYCAKMASHLVQKYAGTFSVCRWVWIYSVSELYRCAVQLSAVQKTSLTSSLAATVPHSETEGLREGTAVCPVADFPSAGNLLEAEKTAVRCGTLSNGETALSCREALLGCDKLLDWGNGFGGECLKASQSRHSNSLTPGFFNKNLAR